MSESNLDRLPGPVRRFLRIGGRVIEELTHDDLSGVAAQMTYYFMLALFPSLILLVGFFDALPLEANVERFLDRGLRTLPEDIAAMLSDYLREFSTRRPTGGILLWMLAALWASSRGIRGARKGLNRVFRCKPESNVLLIKIQDLAILLGGEEALEELHQSLDLRPGALPVLDRERVEGEMLDPPLSGCFDRVTDGIHSRLMATQANQSRALSPASIAIHDDPHMTGHREVWTQWLAHAVAPAGTQSNSWSRPGPTDRVMIGVPICSSRKAT